MKNITKQENFTKYCWICPINDPSITYKMKGFYSAMRYLLDHFLERGGDIEEAIDWVFSKIIIDR